MGWLRDLMEQSDSGCRSYGDLARAALESSDWPAESKMAEPSSNGTGAPPTADGAPVVAAPAPAAKPAPEPVTSDAPAAT